VQFQHSVSKTRGLRRKQFPIYCKHIIILRCYRKHYEVFTSRFNTGVR